MSSSFNYDRIEQAFTALFTSLDDVLTKSEEDEVREFIDVGEYGVAIETLGHLLVEENKAISSEAFNHICHLAQMMGLSETMVTSELESCVK